MDKILGEILEYEAQQLNPPPIASSGASSTSKSTGGLLFVHFGAVCLSVCLSVSLLMARKPLLHATSAVGLI